MGKEHRIIIANGRWWPECIFSFKIDEKKRGSKYCTESLYLILGITCTSTVLRWKEDKIRTSESEFTANVKCSQLPFS